MNFAFNEEQEELRRAVSRFLVEKSPESEVRRLMETEDGYDPAVWAQMAEQLGLQSLAIPESYGGSGFSYVELTVVLEEMGAALYCGPYLASVVLAAGALLCCADEDAKREYLPGIAAGRKIATLAVTEESGRWDFESLSMSAEKEGSGWVLNGTKMFVLDGHIADVIFVVARSSSGLSLYSVDADAKGLTRTSLPRS
jgi:alkylation response protein AidB-like acyl-CoA dehydrogenase